MSVIRVVSLGLLLPLSAGAASQAIVEFDHKSGSELTRKVRLDPGEALTVRVLRTCKARFNYAYRGFVKAEPEGQTPSIRESGGKCSADNAPTDAQVAKFFRDHLPDHGACETGQVELVIPHDEQFGGYIVAASKNDPAGVVRALEPTDIDALSSEVVKLFRRSIPEGGKQESCDKLQSKAATEALKSSRLGSNLENANYLIVVEDKTWRYGIAGGFVASSVTDSKFAVVDDPASTTDPQSQMVVRRESAEDEIALGVSAMIHLFNPELKSRFFRSIAWTFGLGVGDANQVSYFGGISYRFSDQAFFTVGMNAASVDRLPPEQALNAPPTSDNVLGDLGTKTEIGAFIGISYSFLNPGSGPFKGKIAQPDANAN